jgi:hypothetical protein
MIRQVPFFIENDSLELLPLMFGVRDLLDVGESLDEGLVAFQVLRNL